MLKNYFAYLSKFTFVILYFAICLFADTKDIDEEYKRISEMSLQELLNIKITTGTLTKTSSLKLPVSVTTITQKDIANTPARNMLDLIEVYVPSATFVNHWHGPRLGIRGVSGDQNSSFLIIVDGINVNLNYQGQALTEIQNRDLTDIEKIEIIRGPGSVTYGAGAIGGVINIITKKAHYCNGAEINSEGNLKYRYGNLAGNINYCKDDLKIFLNSSVSFSDGIADPKFYYVDRAYGYGYGFMGYNWGNKNLGTPAPNFYEDYIGRPQIKMNLNMQFWNEMQFQARYITFSFTKQQQRPGGIDYNHFAGLIGKQFITSLRNEHKFSEILTNTSQLTFSSQNHRDIALYQTENKPFQDITQLNYSFAENDISFKNLLNYTFSTQWQLAIGGEFHHYFYTPEWGKNDDEFILGFQAPIRFAIYDKSSEFYEQYGDVFCTIINDKINANLLSLYFEMNYDLSEKTKIMISGRTDKHDYSDWALSPRFAWIYEINDKNIVKTIFQQSVRLPAFLDLYSQHTILNTESEPEILKGIELIYSRMQSHNFNISITGYYNTVDQIAWLPTNHAGVIGTFNLAGIDAELRYSQSNQTIGVNYSFVKQLSWKPEYALNSYIDVDLTSEINAVYIKDFGENRINNFPIHSIKTFWNRNLPKNFSFHINGRLNFDFQQEEMMQMFKDAHEKFGTAETIAEMNAIYNDLHDHGYAENSFTSNFQINWKSTQNNFILSLYAMNILSYNNIRYVMQYWEDGNLRQFPRQCGFVEEPMALGMKLVWKF